MSYRRERSRSSVRRKRGAPQWWNFWTPILGTIYGIYGHHPRTGKFCYVYGGKTMQVPWTKRIRAHLWGTHDTPAKPWADTVPGWRSGGTVREVVAAGGARPLWQARTVPLVLTLVEILYAIRLRRPLYNDQHNRGNPRRIPKADQLRQRARRDAGVRRQPGLAFGLARLVAGVVLVVLGLVLLVAGLAVR